MGKPTNIAVMRVVRTRAGAYSAVSAMVGHGAAEPEAGEEAQQDELRHVLGQRARQGEEAEDRDRGQHHRFPADAIRHRPAQERADGEAEEARREHPFEAGADGAAFDAPALGHRRHDIADELRVEAVQHRHQPADRHQRDLEPAHPGAVDELRDVDRLPCHGFPPRCRRLFWRSSRRSLA
jgi:hypothetical protein